MTFCWEGANFLMKSPSAVVHRGQPDTLESKAAIGKRGRNSSPHAQQNRLPIPGLARMVSRNVE